MAQAAARPRIVTEADLPHTSYPVSGDVPGLLNAPQDAFRAFAQPVGRDVEAVLRDDDIEDHAAHRKLLQTRLDLQILSGKDDAAALATLQQIRALEDKESAKLNSNLAQEAFLRARLAAGSVAPGACPAGFEAAYRAALQPLPWAVVGAGAKMQKGMTDVLGQPFFIGMAESSFGPMVAKEHAVSLSAAEALINVRVLLAVLVPCKQPLHAVLTAYVDAHDSVKADIWPARAAVLPPADKLHPVNVAIWDSGIDTKLFAGRLFVDPAPQGTDADGIAFDVMGRPTHGELIPLTAAQASAYPAAVEEMQGIADLQNNIDSPAATAVKAKLKAMTPAQMGAFVDLHGILSGYAHGTHVTGIAAAGNPVIRLAYARMTYDNGNPHMPPTEQLLKDEVASDVADMQWFRQHGIRVVNMSWWDRPSNYEKDLADNGIGKDEAERKQLARHYFDIQRDGLLAALKSAPEILFVTVAGNSDSDNAFEEDIPSSFRLPNLIVTGAVDQAGEPTSFTTYGDNVLIDADGFSVPSVVPGGATVRMSGTSMAAPQVTNLAAKLLAIDPSLTPPQVIELIRRGADPSPDGKLHVMNPKRSVELLAARGGRAP